MHFLQNWKPLHWKTKTEQFRNKIYLTYSSFHLLLPKQPTITSTLFYLWETHRRTPVIHSEPPGIKGGAPPTPEFGGGRCGKRRKRLSLKERTLRQACRTQNPKKMRWTPKTLCCFVCLLEEQVKQQWSWIHNLPSELTFSRANLLSLSHTQTRTQEQDTHTNTHTHTYFHFFPSPGLVGDQKDFRTTK